MKKTKKQKQNQEKCSKASELRKEGNLYLGAGVGLGAFSTVSTLAVGATCPLCVVAVPALIGAGVYTRHKAKKQESSSETD